MKLPSLPHLLLHLCGITALASGISFLSFLYARPFSFPLYFLLSAIIWVCFWQAGKGDAEEDELYGVEGTPDEPEEKRPRS